METTLMLLGMTNPTDFPGTLTDQLKLDTATIQGVLTDISAQITLPMRESLKKIYASDEEDEAPAPRKEEPVVRQKQSMGDSVADILKKSGIELNPTNKAPETPSVTIGESRDELLKSLENPTRGTPTPVSTEIKSVFDLTRAKMENTVTTAPKTTDYSLKPLSQSVTQQTSELASGKDTKTTSPLQPKDSLDPYREQLS